MSQVEFDGIERKMDLNARMNVRANFDVLWEDMDDDLAVDVMEFAMERLGVGLGEFGRESLPSAGEVRLEDWEDVIDDYYTWREIY